jgi:outer membrane lipopolysaccharide assembly protein LptE/RlpB
MPARGGAALGLACVAVMFAACGFHLQGHTPLPAVVKTPYLEAPDRQSDFVAGLRHELLTNGAQLMPEKGKSSAVISVLQDQMVRRVVSVSAANQPNQYEITYTVRVAVTAGDKQLLPAQDVIETRTYSFSEPLLLAKGNEEDVLREDMARSLADRVMRLLSQL